jgi:hypothetical protein
MAELDERVSRFMQSQERARKLIQMDNGGSLNEFKHKAISEGRMSYDENGVSVQTYQNVNDNDFTQYNRAPSNNSKLPKEILESFKSKPNIGMGMMSTGSVLDTVNNLTNGKLQEHVAQVRPESTITESVPTITNNSNIDYSMIKMIVEDCMRKYTSALKKSILNESKEQISDTLQAMKIGDKFSFITKNGDLYEAELKFVKNIKTKKSGN